MLASRRIWGVLSKTIFKLLKVFAQLLNFVVVIWGTIRLRRLFGTGSFRFSRRALLRLDILCLLDWGVLVAELTLIVRPLVVRVVAQDRVSLFWFGSFLLNPTARWFIFISPGFRFLFLFAATRCLCSSRLFNLFYLGLQIIQVLLKFVKLGVYVLNLGDRFVFLFADGLLPLGRWLWYSRLTLTVSGLLTPTPILFFFGLPVFPFLDRVSPPPFLRLIIPLAHFSTLRALLFALTFAFHIRCIFLAGSLTLNGAISAWHLWFVPSPLALIGCLISPLTSLSPRLFVSILLYVIPRFQIILWRIGFSFGSSVPAWGWWGVFHIIVSPPASPVFVCWLLWHLICILISWSSCSGSLFFQWLIRIFFRFLLSAFRGSFLAFFRLLFFRFW